MKISTLTVDKVRLSELFAFGNLTFLALDIFLAHSINNFAHSAEWWPVVFSSTVPLLLLPGLFNPEKFAKFHKYGGYIIAIFSVLLGITGMMFHLENSFFSQQTLKALVYSAPFAGPLAYTGVGLLMILNRIGNLQAKSWGAWVVFLALCGFVGNLSLSLLDHAQNGFFVKTEWISVIAAAFGTSFLLCALRRRVSKRFLIYCVLVMFCEIGVAILGFFLHVKADFMGPSANIISDFIYGAPIFAPLLFANIAILAIIGLWHMIDHEQSISNT